VSGIVSAGEIVTSRLRLIPVDLELANAVSRDPALAGHRLGATVAAGFPFSPGMYHFIAGKLAERPRDAGWYGWVAVHDAANEIIGDGGFHGPPDDVGMVEIGYSVMPAWERRGLASEMAVALVGWAMGDAEVTAIRAETLAGNAPSQAILRRIGFAESGRYDDPEDGPVIVWLLPRERWEQGSERPG
jgi:RimJ/RimL family protein N-acetyltransferase